MANTVPFLSAGDRCYLWSPGYSPLFLATPARGSAQQQRVERCVLSSLASANTAQHAVVEQCIGKLKNQFRCLQKYHALHYDPERARNLATGCAILHNVCLHSSVPESAPDPFV